MLNYSSVSISYAPNNVGLYYDIGCHVADRDDKIVVQAAVAGTAAGGERERGLGRPGRDQYQPGQHRGESQQFTQCSRQWHSDKFRFHKSFVHSFFCFFL